MPDTPALPEKVCIDCSQPFTPTSNNQKRCPACKAKIDAQPHHKLSEPKPKPTVHKDHGPDTHKDMGRLTVLIAWLGGRGIMNVPVEDLVDLVKKLR